MVEKRLLFFWAEGADQHGGRTLDIPLAPIRVTTVKKFMDERVEDVRNGVDGDSSLDSTVPPNRLALGLMFDKWALLDAATIDLLVNDGKAVLLHALSVTKA